MNDNAHNARAVTTAWSDAGVRLDKRVTAKLDTLERVQYVDTRPPGIPTEFDDPEAAVLTLAQAFATRTVPAVAPSPAGFSGSRLSPADQAKTAITEAIGAEILALLRETAPAAVDGLIPAFDAAAAEYTSAVADLPDDVTAEGLMRAGGDAYEAYARARDAAAKLSKFDEFVSSLSKLSGAGFGSTHPALRITSPQSPDDYRALLKAQDDSGEAVRQLNPVWLEAARLGVPFGLNTPEGAEVLADAVAFEYERTDRRRVPGLISR